MDKNTPFDMVISGAGLVATMSTSSRLPKRGEAMKDIGLIEGGAIAVTGERIAMVGSTRAVLEDPRCLPSTSRIDVNGRFITPGLIDPHTHFIFAGLRADEFEMKLEGVPYLEISKADGGIKRTVRETRAATEESLRSTGRKRLDRFLSLGVTTVEVKSGYGLSYDGELKMLRVAKALDRDHAVDVVPTLLAAHEVPPEMAKADYLDLIETRIIPDVAREGLAEFCDVFCEKGVYTPEETRRVCAVAREHGLIPRLHVDQIHDTGGAHLASDIGAISADHLDQINTDGILRLSRSDTVAILLPGCTFFMGLTTHAPARKMIDAGVPVALATDFNPGSCMTQNLPLIMTMACTQLRMTAAEALTAVTVNAAYSLGRQKDRGVLAPGMLADIAVFDAEDHRHLVYHFGEEHTWMTIKRGKVAWKKS